MSEASPPCGRAPPCARRLSGTRRSVPLTDHHGRVWIVANLVDPLVSVKVVLPVHSAPLPVAHERGEPRHPATDLVDRPAHSDGPMRDTSVQEDRDGDPGESCADETHQYRQSASKSMYRSFAHQQGLAAEITADPRRCRTRGAGSDLCPRAIRCVTASSYETIGPRRGAATAPNSRSTLTPHSGRPATNEAVGAHVARTT